MRRVPLARPLFGVEEERSVIETLRSGWVTQGPKVAELERRFAEETGAAEAVGTSSATTGLFLVMHALGIGAGDEVVVPSLTFIASVNAIVHCGASPVFVDVEPDTYNLDPDRVSDAITDRTRAVMAVHQLGLPADLDRLAAVCDGRGVQLIEDAACAVGATWDGRPIGGSGNPAVFSFHPRKVLVAGEGGMICCKDATLAARLRVLRHQGMSVSDIERHRADRVIIERYEEVGFNFRLSDLHASLALSQIERLGDFVAERRGIAARYDAALSAVGGLEPVRPPARATPNRQSYIVRGQGIDAEIRQRLLDGLRERGVDSRRGLMACHLEPCYRDARAAGSLRHTEDADSQTFLLPIFNGMRDSEVEYVVDSLTAVWSELRG